MEYDNTETFSENLLALLFTNCQPNRPLRKMPSLWSTKTWWEKLLLQYYMH